jgi:hypothetical protein
MVQREIQQGCGASFRQIKSAVGKVVGANGFEPSTSWSRTRRASQAALRPESDFLPEMSLRGIWYVRNHAERRAGRVSLPAPTIKVTAPRSVSLPAISWAKFFCTRTQVSVRIA